MKTFAPELENQLIDRLLARDEQAMALFYRNYRQALFQSILRIVRHRELAEDILQESMLKFWVSFPRYDRRKGRLFTWALRISHNLAIDRLRALRAAAPLTDLGDETAALPAPPSFKPEHVDVRDWLQLLGQDDRELMHLLYFDGFTYLEASEKLRLPEGTVKTRGRRIIRTLTQLLRTHRPGLA